MQSAPAADAGGAEFLRDPIHAAQPAIWSRALKSRRRSTRTSPGICSSPRPRHALLAAFTIAAALLGRRRGLARHRLDHGDPCGRGDRRCRCSAASCCCSSAGSIVPPIAPAVAFIAVAAGQSARDYAAERKLRRNIMRAFSQYLSPVHGRAAGRRSVAACTSAASARRCRSCSATCAASPRFRKR